MKAVNLFVYGTLMNDDLLYALTGRHFQKHEAELPGFERICLPEGYPYILPKEGARVRGLLLSGLDSTSLAILDDYENAGVLYYRCHVEVTVNGFPILCQTYVGNEDALKRNQTPE